MEPTRRTVLAGGAAVTVLGCAGFGAAPAVAPTPVPAPTTTDPGEAATLFLPAGAEADGRRIPTDLVEPPGWFRSAGAVYCPVPRSAGSVLLTFAGPAAESLPYRIAHFRELPTLLAQARRLGTDVVYLVDWYEPLPGADPEDGVWNKGDYVPRSAMGGADGLRDGIAAVHAAGGRIVLYVEPFAMTMASIVGQAHGAQWSIRTTAGLPIEPYPRDFELCPANPQVVAWFADVADRLVGGLGADGLFLDSYGNQRGWRCVETAHGHAPGDGRVFDEGCKVLVARMAAVARAARKDAVLLCEGAELPGLFRSVAASQEWGVHGLMGRWTWSRPGRVFTAGWSLDDLHQIVAVGQKLALGGGGDWLEPPPGPSAAGWMAAHVPDPVPDKKDHRFRRFFAEDIFRVLHRWRNAGILLGRPVPNLDPVTPRRWDGKEAFASHDGLRAIVAACRDAAVRLDAALEGVGVFPSSQEHVRALTLAATELSRIAVGTRPVALDLGIPNVAAWRYDGPSGTAITVANVGPVAVRATVDPLKGAGRELVTGRRLVAGDSTLEVPAHGLGVFVWA